MNRLWVAILTVTCMGTHGMTQSDQGRTKVRLAMLQSDADSPVGVGQKTLGLFTNLSREIAKREDWDLEIQVLSHAVAKRGDRLADFHLVGPVPICPGEDPGGLHFSDHTVISSWGQVYGSDDLSLTSFLDLDGRSVGVIRDSSYADQIREILGRYNVRCQVAEFVNHQAMVRALVDGWLEAGVIDRLYAMENPIPPSLKRSTIAFSPIELRFADPTGLHAELVSALDYHLGFMKQSDTSVYYQSVNEILATTENSALLKWLGLGLAVLAGLLGLSLCHSLLLRRQVRWRTRELRSKNVDLVHEIQKRSEVEASLLRQKICLSALNETAVGLMGRLDVDDLLETMVARATALLDTQHGFLLLHNAEDATFEWRVGLGGFKPLVGNRWDREKGLAGRIWQRKEPLCVDHYGQWEERLHFAPLNDLETVVGVPLSSEEQVVGVIGLGWFEESRTIEPDEIDILKRFAEMAVVTLENANLHTALQNELRQRRLIEEDRFRLASAVEQVVETVIIVDVDGRAQYVNPSFEKETGRTKASVVGKTLEALGEHRIWKRVASHIAGSELDPKSSERYTATRADGSEYQVEVTISPARAEGQDVSHYVIVRRDVTQLVAMEREQRHANKMEALGTLAGGIAHDFNNLLLPIAGYSELVQKTLSHDESAYDMLGEILKATGRAKQLVQQILTFGRKREEQRQRIFIKEVVAEALNLIQISKPAHIKIVQNQTQHNLCIEADPTQIHQVIMNLATNAFHAMEHDGGTLNISVDRPTSSLSRFEREHRLDSGAFLRLSVSDTGIGMTRDIRERIFDPYFTTKQGGKGSGMGLAVVHGIVKAYGGLVDAQSEPGIGTTVSVYFPCFEGEAQAEPDLNIMRQPKGVGRILVVDDEKQVLELIALMMQNLGYDVTAREDPTKAWRDFKEAPQAFDLLFTDHNMPAMTGLELAQCVRSLNDRIPIILCTGRLDRQTRKAAQHLSNHTVFTKPFAWRELAGTLREALQEPVSGMQADFEGVQPND